jgi:DNA topoisomerase-1
MTKKKIQLITDPQAAAKAANLVYVSDEEPGIQRKRSGKGFTYLDTEGNRVKDKTTLERIRSLVIPPAWKEVWICPLEDGHIQATGRDEKERKQYRYHPRWQELRDETKFHRMILFGEALPQMRERIEQDMRKHGLPREKVLATVVQLLGTTFIRIGNPEYVRANDSFGLTTLLDDHVEINGTNVHFEFRGKSGKEHAVDLRNKRLARIVKQCQDVPGQQLFQYIDNNGSYHAITSGDVNNYIREIGGQEFTAKDFRTWGGTTLAVLACAELGPCDDEKQLKKNVSQMIKTVAEQLGNTQAVCRKYYVHPIIAERYGEGELLPLLEKYRTAADTVDGFYPEERTVMALLRKQL